MPVIPYVGFIAGTYEHPLSTVSVEQCRNWIPEALPPEVGSKFPYCYRARPGLSPLVVAGAGPWRGGAQQNGRAFVASGPDLYEITVVSGVWTATRRGSAGQIGTDGMPVAFAFNGPQGDQLAIASNGNGFILTLSTNGLAQITDPQFPANVVQVVFWRGHFVWITDDDTAFYLSASYDGTSYVTTDVGEREWGSDYIKSVLVDEDSGEFWPIGTQTTEVWWYNGALGFPAEPVNVLIPYGTPATFGWSQVGTSLYGLAQTKGGGVLVGRFRSGYGFEKISHHALDEALAGYSASQLANAVAFTLDWQGHRFFVLTFDDDATWVFDETTSLWHQWDYWNDGTSEAFLGVGHLAFNGTHVVGSRLDGTLYEFSDEHLDDDGAVIRIVRRAPCVHAMGLRVPHHGIYFDFETGVGTADVASPIGVLRFSDDSGKTWSDEIEVTLGAQGAYDHDAQVRRLGSTKRKGRAYELVVTDRVVRGLAGVYLDIGGAA